MRSTLVDRLLHMIAFFIMQMKCVCVCVKKQTEGEIPGLHKSFPKTFEKLELLQELVGSSWEIPSG